MGCKETKMCKSAGACFVNGGCLEEGIARRAVPAQASAPAAETSEQKPFMWINPSVRRSHLTNYAETIEVDAVSVKFGACTMPLYLEPFYEASMSQPAAAQSPSQGEMDAWSAPQEVWVVSSKTFSMVCATEEIANKVVSSNPPTVSGGLSIARAEVVGSVPAAPSQPEASADKLAGLVLKALDTIEHSMMQARNPGNDRLREINLTLNTVHELSATLKGQQQ